MSIPRSTAVMLSLLSLLSLLGLLACEDASPSPAPLADMGEYVGQEDVLRGLDRIRLNPSFMAVKESAIGIPADLKERVEQRLGAAGLHLLTAAELEAEPGLPEMQIYPSAGGDAAVGLSNDSSCCTANVWISVLEGTSLDRNPDIHRRLPVWGSGGHDSCAAGPTDAGELVLSLIDRFIADLRRANSSETAEEPEPSQQVAGADAS